MGKSTQETNDAVPPASAGGDLPVVACYVPEFLKKDMNHVYRQVAGLRSYDPVVVTRRREERKRFPFDESLVHLIPKSRARFFRRIWHQQLRNEPIPLGGSELAALEHALEATGARLLHIYFGHVAARLLPYLRRAKVPVVVSFHGADATSGTSQSRYRAALAEVFELSTVVLARSEALLATLRELGCPGDKLRLQRTGLPLDEWPFSQRQAPGDGEWRFAQVCRFVPKKGIETTLRAFAAVRAVHPRSRLTLVGDGEMSGRIQELLTELEISAAVDLPGFLDESGVRGVLAKAHYFFHPSQTDASGNQEGIPNAMLEAMALGLPPLATRHGGIAEAVEDGVSGILVDEGEGGELGRRLLEEMVKSDAYARMGKAARGEIESKFSRELQIRSLEASYGVAMGG